MRWCPIPSAAAVIAVAFCGLTSLSCQKKEPLKIGWLSSLTGPLSTAAIAENRGVEFAVEEINNAGGVNGQKIEIVTRDTAGDPTKAVNFAKQLIFVDKVSAIIGPVNSGESLASVPVVAKEGIPNLIIGTLDELTDPVKYPRAFRAICTNSQWIDAANDYALHVLKKSKVAIIADTTGYGTATAKAAAASLDKSAAKAVYTVLVDPNKTDLTDEMNKARAAGADVVMPWSASTGLLARLLNTRGDMGWSVPVVGHPVLMAAPIRPLLNKPDYLQNTFAAGYSSMTYDEGGKLPAATTKLRDQIRGRLGNGGEIDFSFWWVALGYDTVKLVEHAVKTAGSTDPAAIQKAFESTKNFAGVYATYSWGPEERNGYPPQAVVMNIASSFKDGAYKAAPR
jgi:branched-chain amino acid transport system substrate-binding protein